MAETSPSLTGGCACRAVRYEVRGQPKWAAHCHCGDCRRTTGAAYATYAGFTTDQISWSGDAPQRHHSSPGVTRSFCGKCGTPLAYEGERWPGEIHLHGGTLDDPGAIKPQAHVYVGQKAPWVHLADGLPRFRTVPSEGGPMPDEGIS
jgi:hypothetical protein